MKRKIYPAVLAVVLSTTMTMQTFAGSWMQLGDDWYYLDDNNHKVKNSWFQNDDGHWYYLDGDGKMQVGWMQDTNGDYFYLSVDGEKPLGSLVAGWKLINLEWYFFNTIHDGSYGKVLTGWQWIDGYCYYFNPDGKLLSNTITPDGYQVNANGVWLDDGTAVYQQGKGIITKNSSGNSGSAGAASGKGGSSGSSGGSGNSGGNNSSSGGNNGTDNGSGGDSNVSKTIYSYTINFIDKTTGMILKTISATAEKGTEVKLAGSFTDYQLVPGQVLTAVIFEDGLVFDLYYEKNIEIPQDEYFVYIINHIDIKTGEVLRSETFTGKKGTEIELDFLNIADYEICENQAMTFTLAENGMEKTLYYQKNESNYDEYSYTIQYLTISDNDILGEQYGKALAGAKISIEFPAFKGYKLSQGQSTSYFISEDAMIVPIYYEEIEEPEIATPSEPEAVYTYQVECYDIETNEKIAMFSDSAKAGATVRIDYPLAGYNITGKNSAVLSENNMVFQAYYCKEAVSKEDEYDYHVYQIDITTNEIISTLTYLGVAGEEIELADLAVAGYELLGNPPNRIIISSAVANNSLNIYYKKNSDFVPEQKEVDFTIEFVEQNNHNNRILNDVSGRGKVGDIVPIYFFEEIKTADGKQWKSIGSSPRMFELIDTDYNTFTIEYRCIDDNQQEEPQMEYSIRYIAEDTGAILGITTGYGKVGDRVTFRNNLGTTEYGLFDTSVTRLTISEIPADNQIEVLYKRVAFPGPDKDPLTGAYIGNQWLAVFMDETGKQLLPAVSGFSLKDTKLIIDYPDTIELNGELYRAKRSAPYNEIQAGTMYRQIIIEYIKGESSENKLTEWKTKAYQAVDELFKTTPLSYAIVYKELNSWNDIALRIGTDKINSYVKIPVMDITDYITPNQKIDDFILSDDNIQKDVYYDKFSETGSINDIRTRYSVRFQDESGNDLFDSYEGYVASKSDEAITNLPVYYPNTFTDKSGNIWEAVKQSPTMLQIDTLSLNDNKNIITYRKIFDNPKDEMIVINNNEALLVFERLAAGISDGDEKVFYLMGENYSTKNINLGNIMVKYNLSNYSNEIVDSFMIDGTSYYVSRISIKRNWHQEDCEHDWRIVKTIAGSCLINGSETLRCDKCQTEVTTIIPAVGHIDDNYDSLCDVCGTRAFEQILGDEILIHFDSAVLGLGEYTYRFVCIDDDYNGTGKMLYISADDIRSDIYGTYSYNEQVRFEDSALRFFLNDGFADGLSMKGALQAIGSDRVSLLTKAEIDAYIADAANKYVFPQGSYLTKTTNGSNLVLSDGNEIAAAEADNYPVRPILLLDKPIAAETPRYNWQVGDIQAREMDGKVYLFRCVNDNYKDKTSTAKKMALFLCDTVIPANVINDSSTEYTETLFFGDNNNYKYSNIKHWLEENNSVKTVSVNIGIDTAYRGSTQINGFANLNERLLEKYNIGSQFLESELFIPSIEEAIQLKEYLWKFNGSKVDNPETQLGMFCSSYWLRTPEYDTDDSIYTVNLITGVIEPRSVKATAGNEYSDVGIRPMFAVTQYE